MRSPDINTKKGVILSSPVMDEKYIQRCFELAAHGSGKVSPNPLVGSVIVHEGKIIGEGFHQQYGGAHAEVNAIESVRDRNKLKHATLYVNLEPCAHFGKTPPCAPLIVECGIPRVVISNRDPFSEVDGKGIEILRSAGVEVKTDVLKDEGAWLNRRFFTFHQQKRPYIILKVAQTANGFMDINRTEGQTGINWITAPETQYFTHTWRSNEDAILIGSRTAQIDNPSLTVRKVDGKSPHRLLIDRNLSVPESAAIFKGPTMTTIFNALRNEESGTVSRVKLDFEYDILPQILDWAYQQKLQSIIVEGGARTLNFFLDANMWDEARILTGTAVFDGGLTAPQISGFPVAQFQSGPDQVTVIKKSS